MDPLTFYTIGIVYRPKDTPELADPQPGRLSRLSHRLLTLIRRKVAAASAERPPTIPLIECYAEQE
jgi:hypothetical protein